MVMNNSPWGKNRSQCDRCQFFAFSEYFVCAVHPEGPLEGERCLDFDPWAEGKILWAPVGNGFYEVEAPPDYGLLPQPSLMEKLEQIESHPIFSGHCPQCGKALGYESRYFWNCEFCGWEDELNP